MVTLQTAHNKIKLTVAKQCQLPWFAASSQQIECIVGLPMMKDHMGGCVQWQFTTAWCRMESFTRVDKLMLKRP